MAEIHKKLPKYKKGQIAYQLLNTAGYHYFSRTVLVMKFVVVVMSFQVKSISIHSVCSAHLLDDKI